LKTDLGILDLAGFVLSGEADGPHVLEVELSVDLGHDLALLVVLGAELKKDIYLGQSI
jgi:hypothetical protein